MPTMPTLPAQASDVARTRLANMVHINQGHHRVSQKVRGGFSNSMNGLGDDSVNFSSMFSTMEGSPAPDTIPAGTYSGGYTDPYAPTGSATNKAGIQLPSGAPSFFSSIPTYVWMIGGLGLVLAMTARRR